MGRAPLPPHFRTLGREGEGLLPAPRRLPNTGYGVRIGNGSAFVQGDESPTLLFARIR